MTVTLTASITRLEATIPVSADVASEYALIDGVAYWSPLFVSNS